MRRDEKQTGFDPDLKRSGSDDFHRCDRKNGRGAYICPSMECLRKARKNKGLERSFKMAVPGEIYDSLEKEMEQIEGKQ